MLDMYFLKGGQHPKLGAAAAPDQQNVHEAPGLNIAGYNLDALLAVGGKAKVQFAQINLAAEYPNFLKWLTALANSKEIHDSYRAFIPDIKAIVSFYEKLVQDPFVEPVSKLNFKQLFGLLSLDLSGLLSFDLSKSDKSKQNGYFDLLLVISLRCQSPDHQMRDFLSIAKQLHMSYTLNDTLVDASSDRNAKSRRLGS
jgi:hypothetical protein